MNTFIALTGEDVSAVRASIGLNEGKSSSSDNGVIYKLIDPVLMAKIYDVYVYSETSTKAADDIKDGYSLRSGVTFSFAGQEIDDSKFAISDSLTRLLMQARQWYYMFGFFAVFNPDMILDRRLADITEVDSDFNRSDSGVLESTQRVVAEAERLLDRIVPEKSAKLKSVLLSATDDTRDSRNDGADYTIEKLARTTSLRAPSEVMRLRKSNAPNRADVGPAEKPKTKKRANSASATKEDTDVGDTYSETQDLKRKRILESRSRTLDQTITDLRNLRPVSLSDGDFYVRIDKLTHKREVVFARRRNSHGAESYGGGVHPREAGSGVYTSDDLVVDENVFVHVWDGMMPEADARLKTKFESVIRLREAMFQADRNQAEVDYRRSHPVVIVEHEPGPKVTNTDTMTSAQIYGGGSGGAEPDTEQKIRRDAQAQLIMDVRANMMNGRMQSELAQAIAKRSVGKSQPGPDGKAQALSISSYNEFFTMPAGLHASSVGLHPDSIADINLAIFRYRSELARVLDIPLQILDAGASFGGRSSTKGSGSMSSTAGATDASNSAGDKRLRGMVLADRSILSEFIAMLWDVMYRDIDNATFAELLSRSVTRTRQKAEERVDFMRMIERKLARITALAERTQLEEKAAEQVGAIAALNLRLRQVERSVREVLSLPFRFNVHFNNLSYMETGELDKMREDGALSHLEHVNAQRSAHGLDPLTQAQYDKNVKEKLEKEKEKLMVAASVQAETKPPPAAGADKEKAAPAKKAEPKSDKKQNEKKN